MGQNDSEKKVVSHKSCDKPVRMYPNNGLREPVRTFASTFSAVTVVKEMFFTSKTSA